MGKVMFSVCRHLGGEGSGHSPAGGGQVRVQLGGGGSGQSPAGGGVRSVQPGGGQVSPAGGVGQSSWGGGVSPAGGGVSPAGGVSILRPLAGSMPLAFTQEDFLV